MDTKVQNDMRWVETFGVTWALKHRAAVYQQTHFDRTGSLRKPSKKVANRASSKGRPIKRRFPELVAWNRRNGNLSELELSKRLGCTQTELCNICRPFGDSERQVPVPGGKLLKAIATLTGGAIVFGDFFERLP